MPRDPRLYTTFPIDIHRHPKLLRLPVEVRWAFIEMNGEARIADNDGRFSAEDAEFLWSAEVLDALVTSHPTRPLVVREANGGDYVIRDYAEHQQTRAEREARAVVSRENGRKGGRPRRNPEGTRQEPGRVTPGTEQEPDGTRPKAESESESELEDFYAPSQSQSLHNRASVSTDSIAVSEMTRRLAAQKGITSLRSVVDAVMRSTGREVSADAAFQLAAWILDKAPKWPDAPQRYVTGSIKQSPFEVQQFIDGQVA